MKKFLLSLILASCFLLPGSVAFAGGGDSFAGGLAGGMLGGVVAGAMTKDGSGKRAQQDVDQLRREQQQEKLDVLRQQMYHQKSGATTNFLILAIVILFLIVLGLGFMILKKHRN